MRSLRSCGAGQQRGLDGRAGRVAGVHDAARAVAALAAQGELPVGVAVERHPQLVGQVQDVLGPLAHAALDHLAAGTGRRPPAACPRCAARGCRRGPARRPRRPGRTGCWPRWARAWSPPRPGRARPRAGRNTGPPGRSRGPGSRFPPPGRIYSTVDYRAPAPARAAAGQTRVLRSASGRDAAIHPSCRHGLAARWPCCGAAGSGAGARSGSACAPTAPRSSPTSAPDGKEWKRVKGAAGPERSSAPPVRESASRPEPGAAPARAGQHHLGARERGRHPRVHQPQPGRRALARPVPHGAGQGRLHPGTVRPGAGARSLGRPLLPLRRAHPRPAGLLRHPPGLRARGDQGRVGLRPPGRLQRGLPGADAADARDRAARWGSPTSGIPGRTSWAARATCRCWRSRFCRTPARQGAPGFMCSPEELVRVIAGYHAGPGAVDKYGGMPPYETTRAYVTSVLSALRGVPAPRGPRAATARRWPPQP